jgi:hypothetical protein
MTRPHVFDVAERVTIGSLRVQVYAVEIWPAGARVLAVIDGDVGDSTPFLLHAASTRPAADRQATTFAVGTDRLAGQRAEWVLPVAGDVDRIEVAGVAVWERAGR